MKYFILILLLLFSFNLLAIDFSVEKKDKKTFVVKIYKEKEAKDGSTVEVVERTLEIKLKDLDQEIMDLQREIAGLQAELLKKQIIRQKLLELQENECPSR